MQPECKKYIAWPTDVIEPIKFDIFRTETDFRLKIVSFGQRQNLMVRNYTVFGLAMLSNLNLRQLSHQKSISVPKST
jgi:hypothetical protein